MVQRPSGPAGRPDHLATFPIEDAAALVALAATRGDAILLRTGDAASALAADGLEPGRPLAAQAWAWFVARTRHDSDLPVARGLPPGPHVASAGGGLCARNAMALAALWSDLGLEARVRRLRGHVVPEVREGGRWALYDPDLAVRYLRRDGAVASVDDLAADVTLVTDPVDLADEVPSAYALLVAHSSPTALAYATGGAEAHATVPVDVMAVPPPLDLGGAPASLVPPTGPGRPDARLLLGPQGRAPLHRTTDAGSFAVNPVLITGWGRAALLGQHRPLVLRGRRRRVEAVVEALGPDGLDALDPDQVRRALAAGVASEATARFVVSAARRAVAAGLPAAEGVIRPVMLASIGLAEEAGRLADLVAFLEWAHAPG